MTDAKFPEGRKLLALYPVLLFYLSLSWIVLIGFQQGSPRHGAVAETAPQGNGTNTAGEGNSNNTTERLLLHTLDMLARQ